jgi:thymidylate kinase
MGRRMKQWSASYLGAGVHLRSWSEKHGYVVIATVLLGDDAVGHAGRGVNLEMTPTEARRMAASIVSAADRAEHFTELLIK